MLKQNRKFQLSGKQKLLCRVLALCFLVIAAVAAFVLIRGLRSEQKDQETYASLAEVMSDLESSSWDPVEPKSLTPASGTSAENSQQTEAAPEAAGAGAEAASILEDDEPEMISGFATLAAKNPDICGWIYIPGADISYPVMWTPEEPEYYLRRNFYQEYSRSGTPFVGENCTVDSDCLLIYGHNMRNGTMFSRLSDYQKRDFWKSNPTFHFNTLYEYREYRVFAAVTCRLSENEKEGLQYYSYSGDMTQAQFTELTDWLEKHAAYDTGIDPAYGDQLLILSTCGSSNYKDERILVAACRTPE